MNYTDILRTIEEGKEKYNTVFIEMIELDVMRTTFEGDIVAKRKVKH